MNLAAAGLVLLSLVQEDVQAREERELRQFRLEISTAKKSFDPVDLLPVTVRWINVSKEPLTLSLHQAIPAYAAITLEDPSGRRCYPVSFFPHSSGPPLVVELKPREFMRAGALWSLSLLRVDDVSPIAFQAPEPGTWKIWATHGRHKKSEVVTFEVRQDPAVTADVRRLFGRPEWHRSVMGMGKELKVLKPFRDYLLGAAGGAPQMDIMAYALGVMELNAERSDSALKLLRAALDSPTPNLDRDWVSFPLVHGLWQKGRIDEALNVIDRIVLDPHDIARRRWDEIRAGYLKARPPR